MTQQILREFDQVGDLSKVGQIHGCWLMRQQSRNGCAHFIGVKLCRCGGWENERTTIGVQFTIRQPKHIACKNPSCLLINDADVVACMTWGVNAQQCSAIERDGGLVCRLDDALGGNWQNLTIHFCDVFCTINCRHTCDEFGWFGHVSRTTRMHHQFGIREFLHHQARTTRVVKVNVGQNHVIHRISAQTEFGQRFKGIGHRVIAARVHKGGASIFYNQIHGRQLRASVTCVNAVNTVAVVVPIKHDVSPPLIK